MNVRAWISRLLGMRHIQWIVLVIALGLLGSLLLTDAPSGTVATGQPTELEQRLAQVLSAIDGAGQVQVVVHQQADLAQTAGAFGATERQATPSGVIVVAEGAGDIAVRLALARAVQTLLGLPASAVEVLQGAPMRK